MATFPIDIIVNPRGAVTGSDKVGKSLDRLEDKANKLGTAIKAAFAFVGVGLGARELIQLSDTYTNLQNRLRVVTNSTTELEKATKDLFDIAQDTRSSFEGTVELYSRLSLSSKELGVSSKQLTQFTKSLNQAIILSGATAQEANAGLIQFSQGLASGALRGDELRSVLEQLPVVADIIAKQMGITRGELRTLGAEGKISADVVLEAFKNAREELEERFGKTIPTLSQSFQVLKNQVILYFGEIDKAQGISRKFSQFILLLSKNIDTITKSVLVFATAIGTTLALQAIPKAILAIRGLTAALAANPLGAAVIAITTIVSSLILFGDTVTVQEGKLASIRDVALATFGFISDKVSAVVNFVNDKFPMISEIAEKVFGDVEFNIKTVLKAIAAPITLTVNLFTGLFFAIRFIINKISNSIPDGFSKGIESAQKIIKSGFETIINVSSQALEIIGRTFNRVIGGIVQDTNTAFKALGIEGVNVDIIGKLEEQAAEVKSFIGGIRDEFQRGVDVDIVGSAIDQILSDAEKLALERKNQRAKEAADEQAINQKRLKSITPILTALEREGELLRMTSNEREFSNKVLEVETELKRQLTDQEKTLISGLLEQNRVAAIQGQILDELQAPLQEYQTSLEALNRLFLAGKINKEQLNQALAQTPLATELSMLQSELSGGIDFSVMQEQLNQRNEILKNARAAGLLDQKEYERLSLESQRAYNQAVIQSELDRARMITTSAASTFDSLANIALAFAGQQSSIYKRLFALSKAFAIADSSIQILNGIAKAANLPFPANLGAIATVAAATASIVSNIQSIKYSGAFQNGGSFRVGGSGGTDSQMVAIKASPNETVSVRTPGQEQAYQRGISQQRPTNVIVNVNNNAQVSVATQESVDRQGNAVLDIWIEAAQNNTKGVRDVINSAVRR